MPQKSWTIRPYQTGDERQAVALFRRCFGRSMSEAHYRWKMQVGHGPPTNCMLAVGGERVVGQYAAWRADALVQGRKRSFMISVDAMVDPEYRRQGILTSLVQRAHQIWQAEGATCVLALPNEKWGTLREKVGWRNAFPLQWRIRPLRLEKIVLRRMGLALSVAAPFSRVWNAYWERRLQPEAGVAVEDVTRAGTAFDALWERLDDKRTVAIICDAAWIRWRYLSAPDRPYRVLLARKEGQPVGYLVYWLQSFSGGQAGILADLLYADAGGRDALIATVLEQLHNAGAESLIGLALPGTVQAHDLKRVGALYSWGAFDVWILPLDGTLEWSDLNAPANWLVHGGHFDVV